MSAKDILKSIIDDSDVSKFEQFFREKNDKLNFFYEDLNINAPDSFSDAKKIAEAQLHDGNLIICSLFVKKELTERSGKKAQYEIGRQILKQRQVDAGIFIFYDSSGNFRFSLIYTNYLGKRRDWSAFKRFTYFVSKDQTNKTFLLQIGDGDFSTLEKIKEAFSVEKVTKEFYNEIANWYFWAMDKVKFPEDYKYNSDPIKDKEIRNATNLIRLITRIIFIWFLKEKRIPGEKNLIPSELFSKENLSQIVKDFMKDKNSSNFYNAILQNLFFGTLNRKMNERKFAENKGYPANKKEYGVKNLYRYEDKFLIGKDEVLKLFKEIPFLNGGLFDCLDKEDEAGKVIYIDGFSRNPAKQSIIPDYLFFQQKEEKVDLSQYGLGTNKSVRGLIEILNSYNFTIDESTLIDQEVALDPELLGKVFENLLASYNQETKSTARKATGSYYTPREIVDFMVKESLFEYFKEKLPAIGEEKIKLLLSYSENIPDFSDQEKQKIVSAIDEIKILDPACGSGAFPMGILHKIVFVLHKLDPENKYWREQQYQKALKETEEIFKQGNKDQREQRLKEINEAFDENINYPDYARKLYLIENCIYGVDIQPIAIQISKLRFFISLVIDQKVDKSRENFGIRALPNLETKFVIANTLIKLEIPHQDLLFQNTEIKKIQDQLEEERHKYFNAKTHSEKKYYQKQDKILRQKLAEEVKRYLTNQKQDEINQIKKTIKEEELKLQKVIQEPEDIEIIKSKTLFGDIEQIIIDKKKEKIKTIKNNLKNYKKELVSIQNQVEDDSIIKIAKKIADFDLYDQNASADFFDPEWMFGVMNEFDIVIGNPPYIQLQKAYDSKNKYADLYKNENYQTFDRMGDIYCLFYERGIELLKNGGYLAFITSNKWMRAKYGEKLRSFFLNYNPKVLIDFGPNVFESSTVDTSILIIQKLPNQNQLRAVKVENNKKSNVNIEEIIKNEGVVLKNLSKDAWFIRDNTEQKLKEKIERIGKPLKEWDVKIYYGIKTGFNEAFIINSAKREKILNNCKDESERKRTEAIIKPILRGRDIKRYYYEWKRLWVIIIPAGWTNKNRGSEKPEAFIKKTFSSLMTHLQQFQEKAKKREDQGDYWWELRHCAYYSEFEKEKIAWAGVGTKLITTIVPNGIYLNAPANFLVHKNIRFLQGIFNSNCISWYYDLIKTTLGTKGGRFYIYDSFNIPIPPISSENEPITKQIETLVDEILTITKDKGYLQNPEKQVKVKEYERQIDQLVYQLYSLTPEEIEIVEKYGKES